MSGLDANGIGTDRERIVACAWVMGRTLGALQCLLAAKPDDTHLARQLYDIIKTMEADVKQLFYPDLPTTLERS